jgi:hypothetical protein
LEFKENNTFIDIESFVEQNNPCSSSTDPGTWEYNGETSLKISYDGDTDFEITPFSFENGNLITGSDTYKSVWKKIN